jgi:hypothetical protein
MSIFSQICIHTCTHDSFFSFCSLVLGFWFWFWFGLVWFGLLWFGFETGSYYVAQAGLELAM